MKKMFIFVPIFLICVIVLCAVTPAIAMSENISENVLRLHIIANSDSDYDQSVKLKVRDRILNVTKDLYRNCDTVNEAVSVTEENIDLLRNEAQKTLSFYGSECEATAYVTKEYFSTRYYENFTLPAGIYQSVKIEIGEAKGKNWWCVMFPTVCITGCTDDFDKSLSVEEKKMLTERKYIVRFKAVEIYERLKNHN